MSEIPAARGVLIVLAEARPKHMQDHLRILGIVLVPPIVDRLARPGERFKKTQDSPKERGIRGAQTT